MVSKSKEIWWKWGDPAKSFHLKDYPKLKAQLEAWWNTTLSSDFIFPSYLPETQEVIAIDQIYRKAFHALRADQFDFSTEARLRNAAGKSYHDIIRLFTKADLKLPEFVLYPSSEEDLTHILQQAPSQGLKISTFAGGSSVTGALEVGKQPTLALNLRRMNRILVLDEQSHTLRAQPGIFGPDLEKQLNAKGFTLGHFPQSFEYSTLGGWAATRSAGQESGRYGKIEDMLLGLRIVTPKGTFHDLDHPKHAAGIDLWRLFIGSEGTLGVISEVKVRVHKLPTAVDWQVALFKDFAKGSRALQQLVQAGIHPSIARLSDPAETKVFSLVSHSPEPTGIKKWIKNQFKARLKAKGYGKPAILMLRFVGAKEMIRTEMKLSRQILKLNEATFLPANISSNWENQRFSLPYLRDTMVEHRIMIDTFETSHYWAELMPLYDKVRERLEQKTDFLKKGGLLLCHISHMYETGASLYFTLMGPQENGNEVGQWKNLKTVVTDAIMESGGAISHHHGIGRDHKQWYLKSLPEPAKDLLRSLKLKFDPDGIMNPGNLI